MKYQNVHMYSDPLLSTLLKHLQQRLQPRIFLGMTLQAWHTCIWGVSPILRPALSGWMGSVAAQLFSGLNQVRALAGPLKDIQRHLPRSYSCIVLTLCLVLSCWKVNIRPSLRSWAIWSRFSSSISLYFAPLLFASILTSLQVPATEKHPHSMMLPQPCFTIGMVAGCRQTWRLAFMPNS